MSSSALASALSDLPSDAPSSNPRQQPYALLCLAETNDPVPVSNLLSGVIANAALLVHMSHSITPANHIVKLCVTPALRVFPLLSREVANDRAPATGLNRLDWKVSASTGGTTRNISAFTRFFR